MTERSNIVGDINVNVPPGITQSTNGPPIVRTKQTYAELFQEFCTSSTVHGTYFWAAPGSKATKVIWGFIVFCGIGSAAIIINNSFKDWEKHPIMTNVCQAPVEEINMPSLTICPMNDNSFGYVEDQLNKEDGNSNQTEAILSHLVNAILHNRHSSNVPLSQCLLEQCNMWQEEMRFQQYIRKYMDLSDNGTLSKASISKGCNDEVCPNVEKFYEFFNTAQDVLQKELYSNKARAYDKFIMAQFQDFNLIKRGEPEDENPENTENRQESCNKASLVTCEELVADFAFLSMSKDLIQPSSDLSKGRSKGSLLRMLLRFSQGFEKEVFEKYILSELGHNRLYSDFYLDDPESELNGLPLHELIMIFSRQNDLDSLANKVRLDEVKVKINKKQLERLQPILKRSINRPHVKEEVNKKQQVSLNPTFPFCFYGSDGQTQGLKITDSKTYNESYCNAFQTTFNEVGLCYTINNFEQDFHLENQDEKNHINPILKVVGFGKNKGLQIILDSHKLTSLTPEGSSGKGFKVFVTLPGVTTSKVSFLIDPGFKGEHNMIVHGLHDVKATEDFKEWNNKVGACYFPEDKNLTYFKYYSQDNCLLECRIKKVARICGCTPWYLKNEDLDICTQEGNMCMIEELNLYSDELIDRTDPDCDCKNDCDLVHFFTTMEKHEFNEHNSVTEPQQWFDKGDETRPPSGTLANYLLDPADVLSTRLIKNLTKLSHHLEHDVDLAQKRFDEDIAILNIYYDTPYLIHVELVTRTSIFQMISSIGGTLGLFTGISVITLAEIVYWIARFIAKPFLQTNVTQGINNNAPVIWPTEASTRF